MNRCHKIAALALGAAVSVSACLVLCGCGEQNNFSERIKIGVITGFSEDAETISKRNYLDEYIIPSNLSTLRRWTAALRNMPKYRT